MHIVLIVIALVIFPLPTIFGWIGFSLFGTIGAVIGVIIGLAAQGD